MARHKWEQTESMCDGQPVERCAHCSTERMRDASTRSLYLFRRGRATQPSKTPMPDTWMAYVAGVIPKCVAAPEGGG